MKTIISTDKAPSAIGPYSQAVAAANLIFVSGQLPLVPETMDFCAGGIQEQTRQALTNAKAILEEAGSSLDKVVKTTVLLKDIKDFVAMNEVYAQFFESDCPARAAYQVAALPKDALVEIELIALK
ncbi:RidA family protein [Salidesulfovibrio onnuriiensis]|uniref:RidA family protein n=1 Tax=Salidesulfovibrio onnuriiensis TaxID=2583823 RepID=UPI0011C9F919|nr:RidA family protein [Salidesulfovibrio onnuriiensis]